MTERLLWLKRANHWLGVLLEEKDPDMITLWLAGYDSALNVALSDNAR